MLIARTAAAALLLCGRPSPLPATLARRRTMVAMAAGAEDQLVRLDKLLAERGAGSRKDVDRLIRKGLVELDGEVVGKSGGKLKVPYSACPVVDGFDFPPPPLLAAYHKPLGVVSSMRDDQNRPDLSAVLPLSWQKSLHPVGRLDADTTGLLLFSRDGELTHRMLHPKYEIEREYEAEVDNPIDEAALAATLAAGVETIENGESLVVCAQLLEVRGQTVRLTVTEGKYRMVRRVLANAGHPVTALHRLRYGAVVLEALELAEGEASAVVGAPLEWAVNLAISKPSAEAASRARVTVQDQEQESVEDAAGGKAAARAVERRVTRAVDRGPTDDSAEMAMEEAWQPRASDVRLVMEEAGVSREEAVEALKTHRGDVCAALLEL